ncbi:Uma2 family endonuclease [Nocardia sp. BMG51109]|uniref:Uma2 family endonuclease n=1 Tax=Nocardia sp. BMG51109 TaxID=1056816 RepID=UPI0004675814|nr:Uma2 family endonuclease [Nocardia sp. BMG51109]
MTAEKVPCIADFGPYTVLDLHDLPEDGKGFELEDGWLIEVAAGYRHNWIARRLARIVEAAGDGLVVALDGGEWEVSTPSGVRKPDVVVVSTDLAHALLAEEMPKLIPGTELLLAVEVVSPGSASERTDRVRKVHEYAALGIPQYWLVEQRPDVRVHRFVLDGSSYKCEPIVAAGSEFRADVKADTVFPVTFDPAELLGH